MFERLRTLPAFASYSDELLATLAEIGQEVQFAENSVLLTEGSHEQGLYVLIEGEFEMTKHIRGQEIVLSRHQPGDFAGEISIFTGEEQPATIRATKTSLFLFFAARFFEPFKNSPTAALVTSMAQRMRSMEGLVYQQDKLRALGKLSAGMAHELNNPAAANLRASEQLHDCMYELQILSLRFGEVGLAAEQLNDLFTYTCSLPPAGSAAAVEDPLAASDREDALSAWLAEKEISGAWRLAATLAAAGVALADLQTKTETLTQAQLQVALAWMHNFLTANQLLVSLQSSANKIANLVRAVKGYVYMDQAPLQEVDVHDGLENTLLMLGHRLKNVQVVRQYDRSLPPVTAFGSELNQVWTNLIDNALDAMEESGELRLRTYREKNMLVVAISDNGPGIPAELQAHIFEPFVTSKPLGHGTGLGLDIAYRIVTERHGGYMQFESEPGRTTFTICLPLPPAGQGED
jgi:signal transduction histidine kinase